MIESIRIQNLALIEKSEIDFAPGFTVITGETGTGKTMLLTSLKLLLGQRADPNLVREQSERALVEGTLMVGNNESVIDVLDECSGELEEERLEIARVLGVNKSKAHLGGRTVPASTLGKLGELLVSIHGQSDQIRLRSRTSQRICLDEFGENFKEVDAYKNAWETLAELSKKREDFIANYEHNLRIRQENLEKLEMLNDLEPQTGQYEEILREIEKLSNLETLLSDAMKAKETLSNADNEFCVSAMLSQVTKALAHGARFDPKLASMEQTALDLAYRCDDLASTLAFYLSELYLDPKYLDSLNDRISALDRAARQCGCPVEDLATYFQDLSKYAEENYREELSINSLDDALEQARIVWENALKTLRNKRYRVAGELADQINRELEQLGMGKTIFLIEIEDKEPDAFGADQITFKLRSSANRQAIALGQGASGGELSRIMLAIEIVLAKRHENSKNLHTFIFDEVDAGVGGEAGTKVGARLAQLAKHAQVIVVTHLAQVAAFAQRQFVVRKADDGSATIITAVEGTDRCKELARMLSGDALSEVALKHGEELLAKASELINAKE